MKKAFFLLAVAFIALASCSQNDNPAHRRDVATRRLLKKHRIKVAITGQWTTQNGDWILKGAELALEQVNSAGGVLDAQIELVRFDDNNKVSSGAEIAGKISEDREICAVIGHYSSSVSLYNSVIYHYNGVLMLTPFSTNSELTNFGLPYIFRSIPDNKAFAEEAVKLCERKNWKRVMAVYLNNAYCRQLIDSFEQNCGESGIITEERVGYEEVYALSKYTEIARDWKNNHDFDAVFIAGFLPQAAEIVSLFRAEGITQPVIGSIDFDTSTFFSIADNQAEENMYCVSNFDINSTNPAFCEFRAAFNEKYGIEPNWEATESYDAVKVLAKAIQIAESVRAEDVAEALRNKEEWDEGAGPYRFDENGESKKALLIKKSTAGAFTTVVE